MNNLKSKADKYIQQGDFFKARGLYEKILKKNRSDPDIYAMLGYLCGQLNQIGEATTYLKKVASLQPDNAHAFYNLGFACQNQQSWNNAIQAYQRAIQLNPDFIEARYNLAVVKQAAGLYEDAQAIYVQLLKQQPDAEAFLLGSASVLIDLKQYCAAIAIAKKIPEKSQYSAKALAIIGMAEYLDKNFIPARRAFQQALKTDPGLFEANLGLADIYYAEKKLPDAIEYFKKSTQCTGANEQALIKLGFIYITLGRPERAVEYFRQAESRISAGHVVAENNKLSTVFSGLAEAYEIAGDWDAAKAAYKQLRRFNKNAAAAGLAHILERQNKIDEALKLITPLLDKQPSPPPLAVLTYANICQSQGKPAAAIEICEKMLKTADMSLNLQSKFQYKLANLLDATGNYETAFKYFYRANKQARELAGQSAGQSTGQSVGQSVSEYSNARQIAYVDWCIKKFSSTALSSLPHASHSSNRPVFIVGMPRSGTSLIEQILSAHPSVYGAGELPDIYDYVDAFQQNLGDTRQQPLADSLELLTADTVNTLSECYLNKIQQLSASAERVIDKHPGNYRFIGLISILFPQARIIHCTRNPADTCLSIYFQDFSASQSYSTDLKALGQYYLQYQRLMQHWQSVLGERILTVNYQDVVENLEGETQKLLDFIDLPSDSRCIDFYKNKRKVNTPSYHQVRRPIYKSSVARWKNYQPSIGELLDALGES